MQKSDSFIQKDSILGAVLYGDYGGKITIADDVDLFGEIKENDSVGSSADSYQVTLTAKLADLQADGSYVTKGVTAGKTYTCTGGVWA